MSASYECRVYHLPGYVLQVDYFYRLDPEKGRVLERKIWTYAERNGDTLTWRGLNVSPSVAEHHVVKAFARIGPWLEMPEKVIRAWATDGGSYVDGVPVNSEWHFHHEFPFLRKEGYKL